MDTTAFGKLVKTLREDIGWTQTQLGEELEHQYFDLIGEYKEFEKRYISMLEAGQRKSIDVDLVVSLANAFKLNSFERKELFLAVANASSKVLVERDNSHYEAFNSLIQYLNDIQSPAFIIDSYGEIVATNLSIVEFLQVPESFIEKSFQDPDTGFSILNFVCSPESNYKNIVGQRWTEGIMYNIQYFRGVTLRYRTTSGFQRRLNALLKKNPFIRGHWNHPADIDTTAMNNEYYEYIHPVYGAVKYSGIVTVAFTNRGELHLTVYTPLDIKTNQIFMDIRMRLEKQFGSNSQYYRIFADWPKKD